MAPEIPRSEYPRPHHRRRDWVNLNGEWDFGLGEQRTFDRTIAVPFSPQAGLSGIGERITEDDPTLGLSDLKKPNLSSAADIPRAIPDPNAPVQGALAGIYDDNNTSAATDARASSAPIGRSAPATAPAATEAKRIVDVLPPPPAAKAPMAPHPPRVAPKRAPEAALAPVTLPADRFAAAAQPALPAAVPATEAVPPAREGSNS